MFNYNVEKKLCWIMIMKKQPNNLLCKFFSYIHNLFWVILSSMNIFYQFGYILVFTEQLKPSG